MKAVERLEAGVDGLLGRYERLKSDNEQLAERLSLLAREKAELETRNQTLQAALEQAEARRGRVLEIVDSLLRKARECQGISPEG